MLGFRTRKCVDKCVQLEHRAHDTLCIHINARCLAPNRLTPSHICTTNSETRVSYYAIVTNNVLQFFGGFEKPFKIFRRRPSARCSQLVSFVRCLYNDTRDTYLSIAFCVVVDPIGACQAVHTPRNHGFGRFCPSILISNRKPIVSSDTHGKPCTPMH